jgi:hypothetical protein
MYFWHADDSAEEDDKSLKLFTVGVIRIINDKGDNGKKKTIESSNDAWEVKFKNGQDEVYLTNCEKCVKKIITFNLGIQITVLAETQQNNSIQGKKNTKIEEIEKAVEESVVRREEQRGLNDEDTGKPVVRRKEQRNLDDEDSKLDLYFNNENK